MIVPGVNVTAIAGKGISGLPLHLLGAMPTLQFRNQASQKDIWRQTVISIFKVSPNNFTLLKIIIKWKKITSIKDESKGWLASRYRHLKRTRINEEREMFRQA